MALVVGIGNATRSDDGAGLAAAAEIANLAPEAEVIEATQLTPEIAERVAAHEVVIFLDASVRVDRATMVTVEASRDQVRSHGGSPGAIVALAEALYGARPRVCAMVEIPAREMSFGERLSAEAQAGVEEAVRLTLGLLRGPSQPRPPRVR